MYIHTYKFSLCKIECQALFAHVYAFFVEMLNILGIHYIRTNVSCCNAPSISTVTHTHTLGNRNDIQARMSLQWYKNMHSGCVKALRTHARTQQRGLCSLSESITQYFLVFFSLTTHRVKIYIWACAWRKVCQHTFSRSEARKWVDVSGDYHACAFLAATIVRWNFFHTTYPPYTIYNIHTSTIYNNPTNVYTINLHFKK